MTRLPGFQRIAREAIAGVRQAYADYTSDCTTDYDRDLAMDQCELYLYVYGNGNWIIGHAQYLTDHRNLVAYASIGNYRSIRELAEELRNSVDYY